MRRNFITFLISKWIVAGAWASTTLSKRAWGSPYSQINFPSTLKIDVNMWNGPSWMNLFLCSCYLRLMHKATFARANSHVYGCQRCSFYWSKTEPNPCQICRIKWFANNFCCNSNWTIWSRGIFDLIEEYLIFFYLFFFCYRVFVMKQNNSMRGFCKGIMQENVFI